MDFRHFVLSEDRHFMLGATHNTPFTWPQSVLNVLNSVEHNDRHDVLKWIMSEGLRRSLLARKKLADQLKSMGYDLGQDGVFSPEAYKKNNVPPELQNQILQAWHHMSDAEPNYIPIPDYGVMGKDTEKRNGYNLADINAHLVSQGKQPLYFGGPDGLIEHIEKGDWRTGDWKHKDINRNSRYGKQGHDLSLPPDTDAYLPHGDEQNPSYTYKYGLGGGMFVDPKSNTWGTSLSDAERFSQNKLKRILAKKNSGQELAPKEEEILNQFSGIESKKKPHSLRSVIGINPRATNTQIDCPTCRGEDPNCPNCGGTGIVSSPWVRWEDPDDYEKAKACIKAYLTWLFSGEPKTGGQSLTDKLPRNFSAPGKISIPSVNKMNPELAVNRMLKAIFPNDSKMMMANSVTLSPIRQGITKNRIPVSDMLYGSIADQQKTGKPEAADLAMDWYRKNHPTIDVDIDGQKKSILPHDILSFKKDKDVLSYNSNIVRAGQVGKKLVPVDFKKLNDEGYVYDKMRSEKYGDRQIWHVPGTELVRTLFPKTNDNQTQWFEYTPDESHGQIPVEELLQKGWKAHRIESPHNKHGQFFQIVSPEGNVKLIRKAIDASGNVKYIEVSKLGKPKKEKLKTGAPLLAGYPVTPNAGKTGVKQQMFPHDPSTGKSDEKRWDRAVDDFRSFDPTGLTKTYQDLKASGHDVQSDILNHIDNIGFWYGSIHGKDAESYLNLLSKKEVDPQELQKQGWDITQTAPNIITMIPNAELGKSIKRHRRAFLDPHDGKWYEGRLNSANLDKKDALQVLDVIKSEVFGKLKTVKELPEGSNELYKIEDDGVYFRPEIVETIRAMGARWRSRRANSLAQSRENKDKGRELTGTVGGGENGEDFDPTAQAADDYDPHAQAAEEEEKIRKNRGGDDLDDLGDDSDFSQGDNDAAADWLSQNKRKIFGSDVKADTRNKKPPTMGDFRIGGQFNDPLANAPSAAVMHQAVPDEFDLDEKPKPKKPRAKKARVQAPATATTAASDDFDFDLEARPQAPVQRIPTPMTAAKALPERDPFDLESADPFTLFHKRLQETGAIYDPKMKVHDGCGFNWWGDVGKPGGVSITGSPIKKGNRGRKR